MPGFPDHVIENIVADLRSDSPNVDEIESWLRKVHKLCQTSESLAETFRSQNKLLKEEKEILEKEKTEAVEKMKTMKNHPEVKAKLLKELKDREAAIKKELKDLEG